MTKNIKEIGKELMGKSLNSFHRKTGLTQLEKNNEMQDGILDGILSQVDDAYIEKTEQSNVMHLDGSGDGVVVLDSIEGNTKVNILQKMKTLFSRVNETNIGDNFLKLNYGLKPNTKYTRMIYVPKIVLGSFSDLHMCDSITGADGVYKQYTYRVSKTGWIINEFTTTSSGTEPTYVINPAMSHFYEGSGTEIQISDIVILEGGIEDNKCINDYFEGLQSSFEEKVNDEGKYEIEILMKNKNLYNKQDVTTDYVIASRVDVTIKDDSVLVNNKNTETFNYFAKIYTEVRSGLTYKINYENTGCLSSYAYFDPRVVFVDKDKKEIGSPMYGDIRTHTYVAPQGAKYLYTELRCRIGTPLGVGSVDNICIYVSNNDNSYVKPKQNKIKLLINEPLRAIDDIKDRLCVKDGKLVVERNTFKDIINGSENWIGWKSSEENCSFRLNFYNKLTPKSTSEEKKYILCKSLVVTDFNRIYDNTCPYDLCISSGDPNSLTDRSSLYIRNKNFETTQVTQFKQWLSQNNVEIIGVLAEPYYEEVFNEYGEPILLEGYENGTLYIDSIITPTTTIRYTPKMESFKTIKEVKDNNIMLTNDINNTIVPYMMEVDLMIMEKEMAIMSHKNIRKIGVEDMTSMQKRTQQMLERLIKGRTLTEQECQTRVTTYLNANKITDEQAEELMLLISEVYA